ncbi:MAG: hypothetical protein QOD99_2528 [Chthoniobacter sp.]|jgi:hypothetical protein|nr:hypothetical protein [Chthoniobacter sp.]
MKLNLAELKKRWQTRAVLAVTIDSDKVIAAVVRRESLGNPPAQSVSIPIGDDAVLAQPEKAGQELLAQLEAAGIKERKCVVCIPPAWVMSAATDLPEVSSEDLRGYLEIRAEKEFPIPTADLRLAHCAYVLPDEKTRATLVAIPVRRMEAVEKMLETAGCTAVSISLGLDRCVMKGTSPAAMHFLANGSHVDVVIAAGGGIATLRTLDASPISPEGAFDAAGFCREVRITLGRLPEPIRKQVHDAHFGGMKVSAEALCVKTRDYLRGMGIEPATIDRAPHSAGVALDAAENYLQQQPSIFEFVVPTKNRFETLFTRFDSDRRRWIVGAVVTFIVLPILAFMVQSHRESSLTKEWEGMRNRVGDLEVLQQKIRTFRPWFDPAPENLQALEALMSAFPEQGDVWAKSIQIGEESKVTCSGFARNQTVMLAMFDRLRARKDMSGLQVQQVRGENPVQFSFVYKWSPPNAQ